MSYSPFTARQPSRPLVAALVLTVVLWLIGSGCALLCPQLSPHARTVCGEVRLEFPACRRLRLLVHERRRDRAGRLVVRTEWRNESDKPYEARIRVSFFDKEGRKENGSEPWDRQVFQPRGVQIIEWTANTPDAVRYMIEVKSASAWPF